MMSRHRLTRRTTLAGALATVGLPVLARPDSTAPGRARLPRIGFMIGVVPGMASPLEAAFRAELPKLGLIEGSNISLEVRRSEREGDLERQAAELGAMDLDLIVAAALPQALAVRAANPRMPMIVGTAAGLVTNGFAKSLEHPGGIVTGMDELTPGVTARRLELLVLARPGLRRVAILSTTPGVGGHEVQLAEVEAAAAKLGVTPVIFRADNVAELERALAGIAGAGVEALQSFQGGLAFGQRHRIARFAQAQRLPAIYQSELFVRVGGLMAYAPDQEEQFRQAARYLRKVIDGARPGDLPILRPDPYFLTINRTAAAAIGLDLPAALVARADAVVAQPLVAP